MVENRSETKRNVNIRLVWQPMRYFVPVFPSQTWSDTEDLGNQVLSLSGRFLEKNPVYRLFFKSVDFLLAIGDFKLP